MRYTTEYSATPTSHFDVLYFRNVKNAADLFQVVSDLGLEVAVIHADSVVSIHHVLLATNTALTDLADGSMRTKGVTSEIIINLSSTIHVRACGMCLTVSHFLHVFESVSLSLSRTLSLYMWLNVCRPNSVWPFPPSLLLYFFPACHTADYFLAPPLCCSEGLYPRHPGWSEPLGRRGEWPFFSSFFFLSSSVLFFSLSLSTLNTLTLYRILFFILFVIVLFNPRSKQCDPVSSVKNVKTWQPLLPMRRRPVSGKYVVSRTSLPYFDFF